MQFRGENNPNHRHLVGKEIFVGGGRGLESRNDKKDPGLKIGNKLKMRL